MRAALQRSGKHHNKRRRSASSRAGKGLRCAATLCLFLAACAASGFALWQPAQAQQPPPQQQSGGEVGELQTFDPYHAQKSIEAGMFYLKKGHYDAAIDRFEEALRYRPNLARAYQLLGEAYQKKGDKPAAIQNYQKYLEIVPSADDAGKIRKRIETLARAIARQKRKNERSAQAR
jgi:tetratricopeptide (TPR) repeat protein